MRLFVAIEPPLALRREIRRRADAAGRGLPPVRAVPAENLHLTLLFLGDSDPGRVEDLAAALARAAASLPPMTLRPTVAGYFPPGGTPRVLWVGVEGPPELERLQRAVVAAAGRALGAAPEARRFHPHLTVGRCRRGWSRDAGRRWRERLDTTGLEPFEVARSVLMESRLTPSGARYRRVAAQPLEAAA